MHEHEADQLPLSVIVLTWNSQQFVRACLDSLIPQLPRRAEIIVVDNGSHDATLDLLANYPVTLIANHENRGVGPARNQGLAAARGDIVLVLDIDTIVQPGAIATLVHALAADSRIGVVGARLEAPDGSLQYTCRDFPTLLSKLARQFPTSLQQRVLRANELRDWDHASARYVGYVIGACQCIRRQALVDVGPYDDAIFYGPEDVDLCLRMWRAGWRVAYVPAARITHLEQRITQSHRLRNPIMRRHVAGLVRYFLKHRYVLRAPSFAQQNQPYIYESTGSQSEEHTAATEFAALAPRDL
ncbi:MAG TPA: glycosyltransferase family 2 protein [Roseiflexaceae bacterium]|nr:glycosyltransferase family 2 protein [Roseiflexaceae bacterium]HMP39322.1 glycosyltransferase family 2 protein [Roseiflexaceae bacterium]